MTTQPLPTALPTRAASVSLPGKLLSPQQVCAGWQEQRVGNSSLVKSRDRRIRRSSKLKAISHPRKQRLCRAEFAQDAPFAVAIGVCILNSMISPLQEGSEMDKESTPSDSSLMGPIDVRYGAMSIISFIPLFNWLVWVFAWLDTSQQRYLVYAIVYLAPYIKTGLSLSPDDSWLPIASLIACIVHVQLEISVNTGGQAGNEFVRDASKFLSTKVKLHELRRQASRFLDTMEQVAKTKDLPETKVEKLDLPSEAEEAQMEFLNFDEKLARLKRLESSQANDLMENTKENDLDEGGQSTKKKER